LLGCVLLVLPQMYGVGYPVLEGAIGGQYAFAFLLALLAGKILATSLTLSIGGSGGVFAPSLFMGAMLGSAFGLAVHAALPGATANAGAYGLVGMAAVFAAAGRAPITAVIIVFELTGDYSIILPLMLAVVVATGISRRLSADSIYTLKLRRRGIDIERPASAPAFAGIVVGDVMGEPPAALPAGVSRADAAAIFLREGRSALPVLGEDARLHGVLSVRDLERLPEDEAGEASGLAEETPALYPDEPLAVAIDRLTNGEREGLPVLSRESGAVIGWIDHRDVLRAYAGTPRRRREISSAPILLS
jgi:chloride channel protein, CIC family